LKSFPAETGVEAGNHFSFALIFEPQAETE
jgi:hypothetical protein